MGRPHGKQGSGDDLDALRVQACTFSGRVGVFSILDPPRPKAAHSSFRAPSGRARARAAHVLGAPQAAQILQLKGLESRPMVQTLGALDRRLHRQESAWEWAAEMGKLHPSKSKSRRGRGSPKISSAWMNLSKWKCACFGMRLDASLHLVGICTCSKYQTLTPTPWLPGRGYVESSQW